MSPTFLEKTIGIVAAVLVFLFSLRAVPIVIEERCLLRRRREHRRLGV